MNIRIDRQEFAAGDPVMVPAGAEVAIPFGDSHVYGHGFNHHQPYPLERGTIDNPAFAVNNIQCPVWLSDAGVIVQADTVEPLEVRFNCEGDRTLHLRSRTPFTLNFFHGKNLSEAWRSYAAHLRFRRATVSADQLGDCWFCTWTQYPRCIDQERVLAMAREIRRQQYPCSTLIIDDRWESCFGELEFGPGFPDPKAMIEELHQLGFRVILWVTPFVNLEAKNFKELEAAGALVLNDRAEAAQLRWWGGTAGLVDVTGKPGRKHLKSRLRYLHDELGVDGFKIDGGDAKYQPPAAECKWQKAPGASGYSDALLAIFEDIAPGCCETRTAWQSQKRNIIWREGGKDSHWGLDNGLKAVLTLGLHLALLGYDLLIPDMVPGRVLTMDSKMALPTDELMVRWTELSVFFPIVQFSYFPWNYNDDTARTVREFARLHKKLQPLLVEALRDTGRPLLRPLWFDHPEKREYYEISDQFMLGNDLVVAPVLEPARVRRKVVLPPGKWRDAWTGEVLPGGNYQDYPAPCPGIPIFVRAENESLYAELHEVLTRIDRHSVTAGTTSATYRSGLDRDLNVTG